MKTTLQKTILIAMLSVVTGWSNISKAQWSQTSFNSGAVNYLTTVGSDVFICSAADGIWKLSNDGSSKIKKNTGVQGAASAIIDVNGTLYAGTGSGIYKSTDNGDNWTYSGLDTLLIQSLTFTSAGIFASSYQKTGGVFRSTDNGATWIAVNSGLPSQNTKKTLLSSGSTLLVAMSIGIYRSTDNGDNWTSISSMAMVSIYSLGVNGTKIYAANNNGAVYTSTDDGVTFNSSGGSSAGGFALAFIGTNVFIGGANGIALSQNGGAYSTISTGLNWYNNKALAICGNYIYAGFDGGGVWKRALSDWGIVGVNEINNSEILDIFPNPNTGKFTLQIINDKLRIRNPPAGRVGYEVKIYNMLGEKIQCSAFKIQNSIFIDISSEPEGIYFVQVKDSDKIYNQKIVKE